jgi:hypothetical protein
MQQGLQLLFVLLSAPVGAAAAAASMCLSCSSISGCATASVSLPCSSSSSATLASEAHRQACAFVLVGGRESGSIIKLCWCASAIPSRGVWFSLFSLCPFAPLWCIAGVVRIFGRLAGCAELHRLGASWHAGSCLVCHHRIVLAAELAQSVLQLVWLFRTLPGL